jgi:hypothetical protein
MSIVIKNANKVYIELPKRSKNVEGNIGEIIQMEEVGYMKIDLNLLECSEIPKKRSSSSSSSKEDCEPKISKETKNTGHTAKLIKMTAMTGDDLIWVWKITGDDKMYCIVESKDNSGKFSNYKDVSCVDLIGDFDQCMLMAQELAAEKLLQRFEH